MEAKTVFVCFYVCVCFSGVFGQVGSLCRPKERLLSCGCPKTCQDPFPNCKGVCKTGCFCEEGEVRNSDGICVKLADCPPLPSPYKQETSEPRFHGGKCPENEEYRFCEPCNRTCDNPNPICPAQCAKGCFCKGDLLRDKDGRCVTFEKCSNFIEYVRKREENVILQPVPDRFSCGHNKQYKECQKCTQSCTDPEPVCGNCKTGCFCIDGLVKGADGKCVRREECPKGFSTPLQDVGFPYRFPKGLIGSGLHPAIFLQFHSSEYLSMSTYKEVTFGVAHFSLASIEDCSSEEEYLSCGWCEPTCQNPTPECPETCTRGCLCKPPMLRHASGRCVSREQCVANKCSDPNEVYSCYYGCEPRCFSDKLCQDTRLTRRCILGCHCRRGLLRDAGNRCVKKDQCFNNKTAIVVE